MALKSTILNATFDGGFNRDDFIYNRRREKYAVAADGSMHMSAKHWHQSLAFSTGKLASTGLAALLYPTVAHANIVWPGLVLQTRLMSLWVLALGLLIEIVFVWRLFRITLPRTVVVATVGNAASAGLGVVLVPITGLVWAIFPGFLVERLFHIGTFNPFTWTGTYLLAALVSTGIECSVYVRGFKLRIGQCKFVWLYVANAISTGAALVSVVLKPPQL